MKSGVNKKWMIAGVLIFAALCGAGVGLYRSGAVHAEDAPPSQDQAAMPVTVEIVEPQAAQIWKEFSGRIRAVDAVELRPQVSGRIQEIRFEDGQQVKAGDVLYVIETRPYEAALGQAKAELSAAEAEAALAEKEYQRARELIKTDAISKSRMDERMNARTLSAANVQAAKARMEQAQINLDYAHVKSPIDGRVGRAEITLGNLVEAGQNAPVLTTVVSDAAVYADFEVDEQTYLRYVRGAARDLSEENKIPVRLRLVNDDMRYEGTVQSFDNRIDPASGTIRARALFVNEDRALLPGMTVSVEMGSALKGDKILLTEKAIGTDQDRKFVFTVDSKNTIAYTEVSLGESAQGRREILSGLKPGDRVVTEGLMRLRPGMPVAPQQVSQKLAAAGGDEQPASAALSAETNSETPPE